MLNAIIMASGFSNRMGTNKLLLPYKGKVLIEHILDKVICCNFYSIVLVAHNDEVLELGRKRKIKVIYNENPKEGQSEAVRLGIINSPDASGYAFFTGDQPLIDVETIKFLMDNFYKTKDLIIVPRFMEKRGTPVIFPRKFNEELLALKGDTGGREVINKHKDSVKFIEVEKEYNLWDIDTEYDYNKLVNMDKHAKE